ncbi:unnamed protein product, partial [Rotaria sordida]
MLWYSWHYGELMQ